MEAVLAKHGPLARATETVDDGSLERRRAGEEGYAEEGDEVADEATLRD